MQLTEHMNKFPEALSNLCFYFGDKRREFVEIGWITEHKKEVTSNRPRRKIGIHR